MPALTVDWGCVLDDNGWTLVIIVISLWFVQSAVVLERQGELARNLSNSFNIKYNRNREIQVIGCCVKNQKLTRSEGMETSGDRDFLRQLKVGTNTPQFS